MTYVFDFDTPPPASPAERVRLLGGKGANLVVMSSELGLPVPPGFIVSTEACRSYLDGEWPDGLDAELRSHIERLGSLVGRRFADPADPLLVSVRSGAPVSMPGMMDTILDLGLNDQTVAGLARSVSGGEAFAADCLRRFREGYLSVIGGADVPDDPWVQLRNAAEAVFRSWNSDRARAYRAHEGIADDLGTAVTVQAMVFGNRGSDSGTGVLFTRNPSTGERALYGDIMFDAQGEDVVAGTHATKPVAVLDSRLPAVAAELRRYSNVLERHYSDLCDIEFTIERGRLWMLQVRVGKRSPRAALRIARDMAEDPDFPLTKSEAVERMARYLADPPRVFALAGTAPAAIATGLPASPGVASGPIALTPDAAEDAAVDGKRAILVRSETSPEDVRGMAAAAGVLTSRGGLASHAAVVARGWGIPAVVGAESVHLDAIGVDIGGRKFRAGEEITIDGSTGSVYSGELPATWQVAPEAATLLDWARELGFTIDPAAEAAAATDSDANDSVAGEPTNDDVLHALAIKGSVTPDQLAEALMATGDQVRPLTEELVRDGLAETASGQVRLTAEGKLAATEAFAADRARVGGARTEALLDEFHAYDGRMKGIVTAWQIRDVGGTQALNDHTDPDYDAQVLGNLAKLHAETAEWLSPLCGALRRYGTYRSRLARAVELARAGDQRFVASPRVDSYHSVWFELHEDLIRLAGRRRSEAPQ